MDLMTLMDLMELKPPDPTSQISRSLDPQIPRSSFLKNFQLAQSIDDQISELPLYNHKEFGQSGAEELLCPNRNHIASIRGSIDVQRKCV